MGQVPAVRRARDSPFNLVHASSPPGAGQLLKPIMACSPDTARTLLQQSLCRSLAGWTPMRAGHATEPLRKSQGRGGERQLWIDGVPAGGDEGSRR